MSEPRVRVPWSRRRRVVSSGLVAATVTALVLGFAAWWLVSTPPGAEWGFERLSAYLPGKLEVGSVKGPLRGPLLVRDLRYTTDRIHISMDRLALDWDLRGLARNRLDIHSLEADSVRIAIVATRTPQLRDSLAPELPDVDLPLDVLVTRGHVRHLYITPAGSDSAIVINEVSLTRAAFRDTLEIGALDVRAPGGELHVEGRARTLGRYGVDLQSRWRFRTRAARDLVGGGRLVGTLDTLRLIQVVESPFQASIDVTAFTPMKDLDFLGTAQFSGLDLQSLDHDLPAARLDGRIEAGGDFDIFRAKGALDTRTAGLGRVRSEFRIARRDSVVTVEHVALSTPGRPGRVIASGTVVTSVKGPYGDLRGSWQSLTWPLDADSGFSSPRGTFRLAGRPNGYRLSASGMLRHPHLPVSPWTVSGTGTLQSLALASVQGQPLGGTVSGRASVSWPHTVTWRADLAAHGLDPGPVIGAPGSVSFDLAARGAPGQTALDFSGIQGTVREMPVSGHAAVTLVPDGYVIPGLDVTWGANHVTAAGELRSRWNLAWTLEAPDLTRVHPLAAGRVAGHGEFQGSGRGRHLTGVLDGDSLRYRDYHARQLHATANLHPGRDSTSALLVTLTDARSSGRVMDHAELRMDGWLDRHVLKLSATTTDESLRVAAEGGWNRSQWSGNLTTLDLTSRDFGSWALEREARVVAEWSRFSVDGLAWRSQQAVWDADFSVARGGAWTLDTRLVDLDLARLAPFLPPGFALSGPLDLTADVRGERGMWTGDVLARAGPGEMTWGATTGRAGKAPIDSVVLALASHGPSVRGRTSASLGPAGTVAGRFQVPHFEPSGRLAPGPVQGGLEVRLQDLAFVQGFFPDFANTQGNMSADLRLFGESHRPRWAGNLNLAGATDVPRLGLLVREVRLTANSDETGRLRFESSAKSGKGHLEARGELGINPEAQFHANATLGGERFQVMNTREAKIEVTPDARMAVNGDSIGVVGTLTVPNADISGRPRKREAVVRSGDVVFVTGDSIQTQIRRPLRVDAEVRLVLGDNVRVHSYGLDAKPTGSVLAIERPNAPTTGSGELRIGTGTYRAYGQQLTIERGRLVFAGGPINNPGLDVRAVRKARDGVVAGFEVGGTLESPTFEVFSEPAMAQRDALAYVIFGQRIDRGSQNEEDIVTDAANVLSLGGGSVIAETLARKFGIDEASFESSGAFEESSLMLGTYLSPRLYVNYGVGLLDPVSTLRLQYFLNRSWTLQAETGAETGAQILYTVERR